MSVLAFDASDAAYWALAIFLVAAGAGFLYAMLRLGRLFDGVSSIVAGAERDALPVVVKAGQTIDRVNWQLDKADTITDSAVDMASSADTAVRAVSYAIATPVEKVSGFAAGVAHGVSSLRKTKSPGDAFAAGKDAAARRQRDLREDIRGAATADPVSERPAPTPPPEPVPRPEPVPQPDPVPRPAPAPEPPVDVAAEPETAAGPDAETTHEWSTLRPPKQD